MSVFFTMPYGSSAIYRTPLQLTYHVRFRHLALLCETVDLHLCLSISSYYFMYVRGQSAGIHVRSL